MDGTKSFIEADAICLIALDLNNDLNSELFSIS